MKHSEWLEKGKRLYGKNTETWQFKCPVCETIQTAKDFIAAGASKDEAMNSIAVECIGRHLPEKQKAFDSSQGKIIKGSPCNYAGYGLLRLNPVEIEFEDGFKRHAFAFVNEDNG